MIVDSEPFSALNSCEYLYLREISEPEDNTLFLTVEEAAPSSALTSKEIAGRRSMTSAHTPLARALR
jgi:hypothetical protein